MHTNKLKTMRGVLVLLLVLALTSANGVGLVQPAAAQMPMPAGEGIVCTTSPNASFTLTAKDGYIGTPDDNIVYMWGYSEGNSPFQHPGPVLCVNEGDTVTIILQNNLPEDVSITFPGQEDVLADGVPAQPQFSGTTLTSLTNVAVANGGSVTYSFVAQNPGTFLYQSGTNPDIQVRMGLFGVLVVRPMMGMDGEMYVNHRLDSQFNPATEFLVLLSEIDPYLNQAVERGLSFNMANYHPRYWLINGRGFPDSMAPNGASWLPSQPYGALARVQQFQDNDALPNYNP